MLSERKQKLLKLIVEEYIETMQPIASRFLIDKKEIQVGEATIRNEMRALEEAGFLTHPHTSAGRVPTEQGYRYYVENIMLLSKPQKDAAAHLTQIINEAEDRRQLLKTIAKLMSEHSGNAVMIAFDETSVYYTGMAALFAQPEFHDYAQTVQVSAVFDHCEDRMHMLEDAVASGQTSTFIGQQNPLGGACSSVVAKFSGGEMMIVIGPMRMNYKQTMSFMQYLQQHL